MSARYKRPPEVLRAKFLARKNGSPKEKCEDCGFSSKYSQQFCYHHKDGNKLNSAKENLAVLCHNCHSLYGTGIVRIDKL